MRKNKMGLTLILMLPLALTACGLLPEEAQLPATPVIYDYKPQEYNQVEVLRGDLLDTTSVRCKYVPAKEENLSFAMGGAYLGQVYVNLGDQVQAGQLLAELEYTDLKTRIEAQEQKIQMLQVEKNHLLQDRELAIARCELIKKEEDRLESLADTEKNYAGLLEDKNDAIYLQQLQLEELKKDLRQRQIYATMDGTVTFVREMEPRERSIKGRTFLTISDMQTTVFTVEGKNAAYFTAGETVQLTCKKKEYEAIVVEPSDLGLEPDEKEMAYLQLTQPDPALEDGTTATVEIILEERRDVCYVEKKAVRTSDDSMFVYMLDADGFRMMQPVTVGMQSGSYVEIVDGLEEGDWVLVK